MTGTTEAGRRRPGHPAERDEQRARLTRLLADAAAGDGQVALVTGPVATGKTELLHAFTRQAAHTGAEVVTAVCARSENDLPCGLIGQVLRSLTLPAERAQHITQLLRTASTPSRPATPQPPPAPTDIAPPAPDGEPPDPDTARILNELCLALLDRTAHDPLLLAVEDVQHIDPPSLHWLLSLIRRLATARVLLVLTETPGHRPAPSALHTELLRHPHCHHIAVRPLTPRAVAAVLDVEPTTPAGHRAAQAAHRLSGGNPLLVHALRKDRNETATAHTPGITAGTHFHTALLSCLDRCEPAVRSTARALAVLGEHARPEALARLLRTDSPTVRACLRLLNEAGLLDGTNFRHPATPDTLVQAMLAPERVALHLEAAALLHEDGAPATEVAPCLDRAGRCGRPSLVPVLEEAAEHALRTEENEKAVRYLELLHRDSADPHTRASTQVKLVCAESRTNPAAAARRLPHLAETLHAGLLTSADSTTLIVPLLTHGHTEDAARALDHARRPGPHPDTPDRHELRAVQMWLACSHPRLAHPAPPARRPEEPTDTIGPGAGTIRLNAATALARTLTQGPGEHAVAAAEQVLQTTRHSDTASWGLEPALLALYALIYADRLDLAQTWCEQLQDETRAEGSSPGQALCAAARAEIALRRGELATAADQAQHALTLMPPAGWGVTVGLPLSCLIAADTRRGRHPEAAAHLRQPVPQAMFQTRYGVHYLHARGRHYLATDRHYAAVADFLSCRELMTEWGLDTPGLVPWRISTAEAWLRHDSHHDEARRLLNEQLAKLRPEDVRTRGAALRLLAALTTPRNRPALLTEAVAILEDQGDQYELARALADLASSHRELRAHRRAWSVARRAWHVANVCDATVLCEELLPSRSRTPHRGHPRRGATPDPAAALTDAERRVAALAAAGHTNREIADRLCITPSTIEQHLTRVYRKLHISYRRDLPADLQTDLSDTA